MKATYFDVNEKNVKERKQLSEIPFMVDVQSMEYLLVHKKDLKIILVIPTKNEGYKGNNEKTNIGITLDNLKPIIETDLIDQVLVIDSGSIDETVFDVQCKIGENYPKLDMIDAISYARDHGDLNSLQEPISGKGYSIKIASDSYIGKNEVLVFCDADFSVRPAQIQAVVSPLIADQSVVLCKAALNRATKRGLINSLYEKGGRATKMIAKPLFNSWKETAVLNHFLQPLGGLFAFRASHLNAIRPIPNDYRLETHSFLESFAHEIKNGSPFSENFAQVLKGYLERPTIVQVWAGPFVQIGQQSTAIEQMCEHIAVQIAQLAKKYSFTPQDSQYASYNYETDFVSDHFSGTIITRKKTESFLHDV
ncbi:MAG: hypothetical protein LBG64_02100 [Pseudomonadales bacterium]|nr:hypothetical protein [Pseudomonadales bacterium]